MAVHIEAELYRRRRWVIWSALFVLALVATGLIWRAGAANMEALSAHRDAVDHLELQRLANRASDFSQDAAQLVSAAAAGPCSLRADSRSVRQSLEALVGARLDRAIYGAGCFYDPGPARRYFGPYVQTKGSRLVFERNDDGKYDYPAKPWYRYALSNRPAIVPFGPYSDGAYSFVSFLRAFPATGPLAGVASVDIRSDVFAGLIRPREAGSYSYISDRTGITALRSGPPLPRGSPVSDIFSALPYTHARIHLVTDRTELHNAQSRVRFAAFAGIIAVWSVALYLAWILSSYWNSRGRNAALEVEQTRLQTEIETQRVVEERLRAVAYRDDLTGTGSRLAIVDRLNAALGAGTNRCLFFIDIDAFSLINDAFGHASGDRVLATLGERLSGADGGTYEVGRFSGDKFVVTCGCSGVEADRRAAEIRSIIREPITVDDSVIHCTASVGAVELNGQTRAKAEDIIRDAEIAMYQAKLSGRDSYKLFRPDMRRDIAVHAELDQALHQALSNDEFVVHYQPICDLSDGAIVSVEALARWNRPGAGLVQPIDFLPYAEAQGIIADIDSRIAERACRDFAGFRYARPGLAVSINFSAARLVAPDVVEFVRGLLQRNGLEPAALKIEITETSVMRNREAAERALARLRLLGIQTMVDDFGTGYSSLAYLQRLPASWIKIDSSFVGPLPHSPAARAIVESVVTLAARLNLHTVAEGIETAEQLRAVRELGVKYGQGFFFSRPVPERDVAALLQTAYTLPS